MISEMYAQLQSLLLHMVAMFAFAFVGSALVLIIVVVFAVEFLKFRGQRLVVCPETHAPALVRIDALHAAVGRVIGERDLRLIRCSRWEASQSCARECLNNWR